MNSLYVALAIACVRVHNFAKNKVWYLCYGREITWIIVSISDDMINNCIPYSFLLVYFYFEKENTLIVSPGSIVALVLWSHSRQASEINLYRNQSWEPKQALDNRPLICSIM